MRVFIHLVLMKFYDEASITVISGRGGDGVIAGRREAGVPFGGPAGGDGGRGGSIYMQANENLNTLMHLRYKRIRKAPAGKPGQSKDKYGADGEHTTIEVPVGTIIKDQQTGAIIAHLEQHGERLLLVEGGKGGLGNIHFKNAHNQFPNIALLGEPPQQRDLLIELQLLGDVALIGTPSAGKSSMINTITNVKAKTADYEFTTLVPHLGIVDYKQYHFSVIDVPGLIAGASEGKGLGNIFLRHVLKARMRVIMLNIEKDLPGITEWGALLDEILHYLEHRYTATTFLGYEIESIRHDFSFMGDVLQYKLLGHHADQEILLIQAHILTVANKVDLLDDELREEYKQAVVAHMQQYLAKYISSQELLEESLSSTVLPLSTFTQQGVDAILDKAIQYLHAYTPVRREEQMDIAEDQGKLHTITEITDTEKPGLIEAGYIDARVHDQARIWSIEDRRVAYLTFVLPRGNDEAEHRYRRSLERELIITRYREHGVRKGDILKIISPYLGTEDKYILWD